MSMIIDQNCRNFAEHVKNEIHTHPTKTRFRFIAGKNYGLSCPTGQMFIEILSKFKKDFEGFDVTIKRRALSKGGDNETFNFDEINFNTQFPDEEHKLILKRKDSNYVIFSKYVKKQIRKNPDQTSFSYISNQSYNGVFPNKDIIDKISRRYLRKGFDVACPSFADPNKWPRGIVRKGNKISFSGTIKIDLTTPDTLFQLNITRRTLPQPSSLGQLKAELPLKAPSSRIQSPAEKTADKYLQFLSKAAHKETQGSILQFMEQQPEKEIFTFQSDAWYGNFQPSAADLTWCFEHLPGKFSLKHSESIEGIPLGTLKREGNITTGNTMMHGCTDGELNIQGKKLDLKNKIVELEITRTNFKKAT